VSTVNLTAEEMTESLTGFDEIAVEKHLDLRIYADAEREPVKVLRALVFVHRRREGDDDAAAKQYAMDLPLKALQDYFAEDEEVFPDAPETESGKDGGQPD
jgi:hypothetical protein